MEISIPDTINKVEKSATYKDWTKGKKTFLMSIVLSIGDKNEVLVNYYDPDTDKAGTFNMDNLDDFHEDDIFKREEDVITKLDVSKVKMGSDKALRTAEHEAEVKDGAKITKKIAILQHLDKIIWNITLVSSDFKTINVKIDAITEEIDSYKANSIADLMKE